MKIKNVLTAIGKFTKKNGTTICAGTSIVCTAVAVVTAVIGTTKAVKDVEAAEKEKGEKLTKKEVVKTVWKHYIPTVLSTAGSFTASVAGDRSSKKQISTLTATIGSLSAAHEVYKDDIKKALGDGKYEELRKQISEEKTKQIAATNERPLDIQSHDGKLPCKDLQTGKWFFTSWELANEARIKAIKAVDSGWWYDIASLYYEMEVPSEEIGNMLHDIGFNESPHIMISRNCYQSGGEYLTIDYDYDTQRKSYGDR